LQEVLDDVVSIPGTLVFWSCHMEALKKPVLTAFIVGALVGGVGVGAFAESILQKVLVGGVGVIGVTAVAKPLNAAINQLMLARGLANKDKTKVVPILTLGSAQYIGAAQVSGPAGAIDAVKAVVAYKGSWNNGVWTIDALVPVDTLNPVRGVKRVYGTGVDAIVNAKL